MAINNQTTASFLSARTAMSTLVTDLQNMASSATSSASSGAASGASNLLKNPDFQNLENAFSSGDPKAVNTAWSQFIANTFGAMNNSSANAATSTLSAIA
jgi:hypothetical protein